MLSFWLRPTKTKQTDLSNLYEKDRQSGFKHPKDNYDRTGVAKETCKEPRSYVIQSEVHTYRRNRKHIPPVAEPAPTQFDPKDSCQDTRPDPATCITLTGHEHTEQNMDRPMAQDSTTDSSLNVNDNRYRTRSGRISKPNPTVTTGINSDKSKFIIIGTLMWYCCYHYTDYMT